MCLPKQKKNEKKCPPEEAVNGTVVLIVTEHGPGSLAGCSGRRGGERTSWP